MWIGFVAPLNNLKVYIKIVKQHAPKNGFLNGYKASGFCCLTGNKFKEEFNTKDKSGIGVRLRSGIGVRSYYGDRVEMCGAAYVLRSLVGRCVMLHVCACARVRM